jgi:hypothetical protein
MKEANPWDKHPKYVSLLAVYHLYQIFQAKLWKIILKFMPKNTL